MDGCDWVVEATFSAMNEVTRGMGSQKRGQGLKRSGKRGDREMDDEATERKMKRYRE